MKDSLFFDRTRLEIMTVLVSQKKPLSFYELLEITGLTKGNLSSHLKRLEDSLMIQVTKDFFERKPRTTIVVSKDGEVAFKNHLQEMQNILKQISKPGR